MKPLLFGASLLAVAVASWRYSRFLGSYIGRGVRLRPLSREEIDGVSTGIRVLSGMLFVIFLAWCVVWIRSLLAR